MKKYFISLICLILAGGQHVVYSQENIIDGVIWVVGDDAILRSDVENMRLQMQFENQRIPGDPYCVIPEKIAIQKLFLHQAKLDSIDIPEAQVSQYLDARVNYSINQAGSKEKLEEYLNKPLAAIKEEWRQSVREQFLVQGMQQKLASNVKVTPVDVRNFYNSIPTDSLPFIPTTVEVEIVTVQPKISFEETDEIKRRLREFTDLVNSGEREFSTLARLYSEDKESAQLGGELGFVGKGSLVPEFAAVAFELNDPKRVSRIVETEYGFHIIQLIEKRGDRINVRHILLRPRVSKEELQAATLRLDSIRTDMMDNKFTFEEAATYISDDKDTRMNKGLMVNQNMQRQTERSGTSRFEMDELAPEIARVVANMEVGDISQPFTLVNSKQKEVAAIVRLKSRSVGHKASINEDYQILKAMVEEKKKEEVLDKWIKEKIQNTYIRINEDWKHCDFELDGWIK